ncbi:hypothetical protein YO5_04859 [Stutzerimonas stutzeri TS44]|nr:hypothetical protein YO5_04859 [Stutzerimonas stutzeri TS44]
MGDPAELHADQAFKGLGCLQAGGIGISERFAANRDQHASLVTRPHAKVVEVIFEGCANFAFVVFFTGHYVHSAAKRTHLVILFC